jgi:hypothetical protein
MAAAGEVAPSSRTWRPRLLTLALLLLLPYWLLADAGVCFPQARRLSEREMIVAALSSRPLQGMRPGTEDSASFAAQHPECCRLNRHPDFRSWWDVLLGFNVSAVEIRYPVRQGYAGGKYYQEFVSVSACGRPLTSRDGTGTDKASVDQGWTMYVASHGHGKEMEYLPGPVSEAGSER